jgi:hypothetical protein
MQILCSRALYIVSSLSKMCFMYANYILLLRAEPMSATHIEVLFCVEKVECCLKERCFGPCDEWTLVYNLLHL